MPRRDDIHKILILGSGPIVIGQAAEFDYSGVQACKILKEEGYEVVLVNSNPATIMTDPEFATRTYIEPLLPGPVRQVIERERPDALLPTLGGQTALNLARTLHEDGTLERFDVELIGANYDAIGRAEDRDLFRQTMEQAGLEMPRSAIAHTLEEAEAARPRATIRSKSSRVRAMPPPRPPSVNAGRMIAGSPRSGSASSAWATLVTMAFLAVRRPAACMVWSKSSRSSALWIAS